MRIESSVIPLQSINDAHTKKYGVNLFVLRLDLHHQHISGNKIFKLKYNLEEAKRLNKKTILTFGGAFSNHIAATAAAGKEYGFKTIGIIRGEKHPVLNPTLKFASDCGMQIHYVSREEYKNKQSSKFLNFVIQQFGDFYLIPEGGANELGIIGCKEITSAILIDFDFVCCACGTGATMAGITLSLKQHQRAIGFQILKSEGYIRSEVEKFLASFNQPNLMNWEVNENYQLGGYAKLNFKLINFVDQFKKKNDIQLDYVYTGKMMFGIYDLMEKIFFKRGQTIIAIHTGGLQGNAGFENIF